MIPSTPDTNDPFSERLRLWRVSQDLTQAEAAERLNIDRSYLSQLERGRPPGKALWTRYLLIEKSSSLRVRDGASPSYGLRNLPVLTWTQAGQTLDPDKLPLDCEVVPGDVRDERAFGVRLRGDSMEPKFSDGDIAILLPGTAPTNGEVVVANVRNQGVICKIMHVQLDKSLIKFSSYNPAHLPTEYHRDELAWVFPVATIIKHLHPR